MSAHVLLNELEKRDTARLAENFIFFRNGFNRFNNTGARMLDSIYYMTLKLLKNHIFGAKTSRCCHLLRNVIMDVITLRTNLDQTCFSMH